MKKGYRRLLAAFVAFSVLTGSRSDASGAPRAPRKPAPPQSKNATLSRITKTNPDELGLDFWIRMGTFVLLPALGLLAAQFPEINGVLFSWLEPAMQSLK